MDNVSDRLKQRRPLEMLTEGEPSDNVMFFDDQWLTRAELVRSAQVLARELDRLDLAQGNVVGGLLPSHPAAIVALAGCWLAGVVYAPVNPRLTAPEIERSLESAQAAAVLVDERTPIPLVGARMSIITHADLGWRVSSVADPGDWRTLDADVALVLFTSGTTGAPKPVMMRHSGITASITTVVQTLRRDSARQHQRRANLVVAPLYLWSGIYGTFFAFSLGDFVIAMPHFEPYGFARLVRQFGIRSVVLAPGMLGSLLASDITDLAPLRYVRNGTAPLDPNVADQFSERFSITVLNGYGQTELGGEVIGWSAETARTFGQRKRGSVGRPHPGVGVRILRPDLTDAPVGEIGELYVMSSFRMAGYLGAVDAGRLHEGEWLRTGDIGRIDEDGFLFLSGRVSDVINRSGLKVFPDEVELEMRRLSGVQDVSVTGVPDSRLGEVPWAFVIPQDKGATQADANRLLEECRKRLAPYKIPAGISFVEYLSRNDNGKVLRRQLAETFRQQARGEIEDRTANGPDVPVSKEES